MHCPRAQVGVKRARMLPFPGGFVQLLLATLAKRSGYLRALLESAGDDGIIELPGELASLWLEGMMLTPPELRATATATLKHFLEASEFFQDSYLVKELFSILSSRVFAAPSQQDSAQLEQPAEVLDGLSDDQAMEVLRSAPGSFEEHFLQLSTFLRPLAALAHLPNLAATCSCAAQADNDPNVPVLTLCVDTKEAQADLGIAPATADPCEGDVHATAAAECTAASMWPVVAEMNEANVGSGLFSLEQRQSCMACSVFPKSHLLQNCTIELPASSQLVLSSCSGGMSLRNVTLRGGAVVCMGSSFSATLEDVVFERCSLLVLSGAHATLHRPHFRDMASSAAGLSVFAHGAGSRVVAHGGSISRGSQGVTVQAGACLQASDLTITSIKNVGVEVRDEGSLLSLSGSKFHEFSEQSWMLHVHERGSAHLSHLSMSGMSTGVYAHGRASIHLADCSMTDNRSGGVHLAEAATGHFDRCTLSRSEGISLLVSGTDSCAHAANCQFLDSSNNCGVSACDGGMFTASACTSSGHKWSGYVATGEGSMLQLTDCTSTDNEACGCDIRKGARAVLNNCTASNCRLVGVNAIYDGSHVEIEGCHLEQNGNFGVAAYHGAVVEVRACSSSGHERAGYAAYSRGMLTISSSTSEGDAKEIDVGAGGQLDGITVDGAHPGVAS